MIVVLKRGEIDMVIGAMGEDSGAALVYSCLYLPRKQFFIELIETRLLMHWIVYVDTQISLVRLWAAYLLMMFAAYFDLIGVLLAVSFGDVDVFVGDMTVVVYVFRHFKLSNVVVIHFVVVDEDGYRFVFVVDWFGVVSLWYRIDDVLAVLLLVFLLFEYVWWNPSVDLIVQCRSIELSEEEVVWVKVYFVVYFSMLVQGVFFSFRDLQGQSVGVVVDLLNVIGRVMGLRFEVCMRDSIDQLMVDMKSGTFVIVPYGIGDVLMVGMVFSALIGEGIFVIVTVVGQLWRRDAAAFVGKWVAFVAYVLLQIFVWQQVSDVRFIYMVRLEEQFHAVARGEADATVIDLTFVNYWVGNLYRGSFVVSGVLLTQLVLYRLSVVANELILFGIINCVFVSLLFP